MAIWNERIKELRRQSNLTLKEVATSVGTTEATMQRYESGNGIKNIPYEVITKLSVIFDCDPSYIMGYQDKMRECTREADQMDWLMENMKLLGYEINPERNGKDLIGLSITDSSKRRIQLYAEEIQKLLNTVAQATQTVCANTVNEKIAKGEVLIDNEDCSSSKGKITTIEEARAFLRAHKGEHIAAFGGDESLSDEAIIQIANIISSSKGDTTN